MERVVGATGMVGGRARASGGDPFQHVSEDPLERTFGALMLECAEGNAIPRAPETAERYGVTLRSVSEWAREVVGG